MPPVLIINSLWRGIKAIIYLLSIILLKALFRQFYSLFQHILTNVASGQFGGREGGVSVGGRGLINIDFPLPLFQVLHGNPGDYAWGQGGLDVVITQV
jgi:hypothetical protein